MKWEIKELLAEHMKDFGLHIITRGLVNLTFNEITNPYNHSIGIVYMPVPLS